MSRNARQASAVSTYTWATFRKADANYQQSLKIRLAKLGPVTCSRRYAHQPRQPYGNIGEYAKAASFYEQSLKIYQAKLGPDHPDLGNNLYNLGNLYWHTHEYVKAEPFFSAKPGHRRKQLGRDHLRSIRLYGLPNSTRAWATLPKPSRFIQRCLKNSRSQVARRASDIATTLDAMGSMYKYRAIGRARYRLPARLENPAKRPLGPSILMWPTVWKNLASAYERLGKPADAEPLVLRSLSIRRSVYPPTHPAVISSNNNLATLYLGMDNFEKAEPALLQQLKNH